MRFNRYNERLFWEKVEKAGDCWVWTGARKGEGYGNFSISTYRNKQFVSAHRFSWVLSGRLLAKGKVLHHTCGNRLCVNPAHLVVMQRGAHAKMHKISS